MKNLAPWMALPVSLLVLASCSDRGSDDSQTTTTTSEATSRTSGTPSGTATSVPSPEAAAGSTEFEGARAMEHIRVLSEEIGPRVSGTDGEKAATEYLAAQFRSYGYEVEMMNFTFSGDRFNRVGSVVEGDASFEALALVGSAAGKLTGPTVFVGLADAAGISGKDLSGKIAVAMRGTTPFADKYEKAKSAGATALVIINNAAGPVSGDLNREATIPVVAVPGEAEGRLKAAANIGATVTVDAPGGDSTQSVNVIARPSKGETCTVLIGGHHDTVPAAPGANDNASGAGTIVELARAFAADGTLDPGLCFVTFGAEESGLFGSEALATKLKDAGTLPRFMVNIDVAGIGNGVSITATTGLGQRVLTHATDLGVDAKLSELASNSSSDHASFRQLGVPVVFIWSDGDFPIHTPEDAFSLIEADEIERVGDLNQRVIADFVTEVARG